MKKITLITTSLFLFFGATPVTAYSESSPPQSQANSPLQAIDTIQTTVDKLIDIVGKFPGEQNGDTRRTELRKVLNGLFDFEEMAKRSLGPQWKDVSPEDQVQFVNVFSDLLARTYLQKIEKIQPGMVKFDREQVEPPRAVVKTLVSDKGEVFPLDYKLLNTSGTWKVYDVVIENIGLVANYRNEFAGIIRKETFSGLLKRLQEKA